MMAVLIALGGVCHFGILIASALLPKVLAWRTELRKLDPLSRHIVWTHGAFIVLTIIGFGVLSLALAPEMAAGTLLARAVCGFIGIFWLVRLVIQVFVLDARPHLTRWWLEAGYHGLTGVFTYLAGVYLAAAVMG
jgi:hypothetical protein